MPGLYAIEVDYSFVQFIVGAEMAEWLEFEVRLDSGGAYRMKVHRQTSVGDLKDTLHLSHDVPEPKTQQLYQKGVRFHSSDLSYSVAPSQKRNQSNR